jgi:hypothetical protein
MEKFSKSEIQFIDKIKLFDYLINDGTFFI